MPIGLPPTLSDIVSTITENITNILNFTTDYYEIPNSHEWYKCASTAINDILSASKSTLILFILTFRPFIILFLQFSRYFHRILRMITEEMIYHGIKFVYWQKKLSWMAILSQVLVVLFIILMYVIKRHIRKQKYIDRIFVWYCNWRSLIFLKYISLVELVADTSVIVAIILPHAIYLSLIVLLKYFAPWLVQAFATKTWLFVFMSQIVPLYRTILVLDPWADERKCREDRVKCDEGRHFKITVNVPLVKENSDNSKTTKTIKKKCLLITNSDISQQIVYNNSSDYPKLHYNELMIIYDKLEIIKYWVIYGSLLALSFAIGWLSNWTISSKTLTELRLFFFIWLCYLPTSPPKKGHGDNSISYKSNCSKSIKWNKFKTNKYWNIYDKKSLLLKIQPLDIIYKYLSPLLKSVTHNFFNLSLIFNSEYINPEITQTNNKNIKDKVYVMKAIAWCSSFLNMMTWTKLISADTKDKILMNVLQCTALLPSLITLLMPSYFTQYGVIYVSLVFPAASSAYFYDAVHVAIEAGSNKDVWRGMVHVDRFLQYWIIHLIFYSLLSFLTPIFFWFPLSTHFKLVLWVYLLFESTTSNLYKCLKSHLMTLSEFMCGFVLNINK